jgi:integrase
VAKNNHRRFIVALFNFAKAQGWLSPDAATAADALGAYKVKEKDVEIYTPCELVKLLEHADEEFLPYIALLAFGGIRRDELHKGLTWEAVNFAAGSILVPSAIAKTGKKRKIVIPANLAEWLAPYQGRTGPIFAIDPRKRMAALSKAAGVPWKRNALRHSFGSYRMEATKNAGQVSLEMGNSAAVVMAHYFEIVDAKAAVAYWNLLPSEAAANVVPIDVVRRRSGPRNGLPTGAEWSKVNQ